MALLSIVQYPDPVLRRYCLPVVDIDDALVTMARDMLETMYAAPGRGLAAPQVGVALRLFVMDTTWREGNPNPRVVLNPDILAISDRLIPHTEGCLSIPDVPARVYRPDAVTMAWYDLNGERQEETFYNFDAICVQHEFDHLNGRLVIDLLSEHDRADVAATLQARSDDA